MHIFWIAIKGAGTAKYKCLFKKYLTPLLWIAKTSAIWRLKIASKSFDAFFPRKRRKVPRFQFNKLPIEKSADICVLQSTNLPFAKILRKLGSRSLSTCPYHWFYPLCHTGFTWRESTFIKEKCENRGLVWSLKWMKFLLYYCTAIWQLHNNTYRPDTYIFQKVSFRILYLCT